jgi:hypothetical protein
VLLAGNSTTPDVNIDISCLTGLFSRIEIDGTDVLVDKFSTDLMSSPCRIHMHRASIDNDKIGYFPRWKAVGLDVPLQYSISDHLLNHTWDSNKSGSVVEDGIVFVTPWMTVDKKSFPDRQELKMSWLMTPEHFDRYFR